MLVSSTFVHVKAVVTFEIRMINRKISQLCNMNSAINGRLVGALIPQLTFSVVGFWSEDALVWRASGEAEFLSVRIAFLRAMEASLDSSRRSVCGGWRLSQIHRRRSSFREGRLLQLLLCRLMNDGVRRLTKIFAVVLKP
ncbi:hypothetical protein Bca4012_053261 [Brassica carinata]